MKIFSAVSNSRPHFEIHEKMKTKNFLISYYYFPTVDSFFKCSRGWLPENLMIDSGAFTVWTKQQSIDIDDYIEFCKEIKEKVNDKCNLFFVNLDVLPGAFKRFPTEDERKKSAEFGWKNMEYIESKGLKVIPVFHQHEDFEWLKKMMKHTDYIGVSPANDEPQASKINWLKKVFSITEDKVKTHGFAVTSYNTLFEFPFYSADSSSWVVGARYARIPVFSNGKFKCFHFKEKAIVSKLFHNSESKSTEMLTNYKVRTQEGIRAYQKMEDFITKVWEKRNIVWTT